MLRPKRRSAQSITVTAPVGGWNAVNSLASMEVNEAVIIDNWYCLPTELQLRRGYTPWATGLDGNVNSFITYDAPDGTAKFFAATDTGKIYNVSVEGAVGAAVVTGLTNGKFHSAQFANSGGNFTTAVNGADSLLLYNGTTVYPVTGVSTPYAITGVSTSLLNDVVTHKRRMWFSEKGSLRGWYLDTDAVAGVASMFDFGPLFAMGGSIAKLTTWTLDAGSGMDDYFVVITTAGEIAVYTGTNPDDAATWSLSGVYYVGSPIGALSTCKYAGDVLFLNKDGLIPLSQCLMSSRVSTRMAITNKIQRQISQDTIEYGAKFGWQVIINPPLNMLLINVPNNLGIYYQYVMNTITGAWSRFTNINTTCWTFMNESLYFGGNGTVSKFWDGKSDNGVPIESDLLPAFSAFGNQVQIKKFSMTRISMGADARFSFNNKINLEFDKVTSPNYPQLSPPAGLTNWDAAIWDSNSWAGDITPFFQWQMAAGMGYYATMRLKTVSTAADVRFYSIDYVYEAGSIL